MSSTSNSFTSILILIVCNTALAVSTVIIDTHSRTQGIVTTFNVTFRKQHKQSNRRYAPDPYGMSGCGVWIDPLSQAAGKIGLRPVLLGIATDYIRHPIPCMRCIAMSPFKIAMYQIDHKEE